MPVRAQTVKKLIETSENELKDSKNKSDLSKDKKLNQLVETSEDKVMDDASAKK